MMRNVKDYGAVGDGEKLDTAAFQKAIDDGGMVYVPEGIYKIGTLYLKSNGGLHLAIGSVLRGSHRREDYNADDFCPQNAVFVSEHVTGAHLITAVEQENIVIEGRGTIDGQGDYWMNESNTYEYGDYVPNDERPGQMIFICECKNVRVTDVNIVNGPYWHLFFHGCDNVIARGLSIHGDRPRWTNDGIDIDCCSRVTVSDCIIDTGDDGITLRGHYEPLKKEKVCENITITNCVIHAEKDYGIRIGVGKGLIRNCTISNMVIEAPTWGGIGILSRWSDTSTRASSVENIVCSNLNIHARLPVEICVAYGDAPLPNECYIKNVRMDNLMLFPTENNIIRGFSEDGLMENICLSNVTVKPDKSPYWECKGMVEIKNANDVVLDNFKIIDADRFENDGVSVENSRAVVINGEII